MKNHAAAAAAAVLISRDVADGFIVNTTIATSTGHTQGAHDCLSRVYSIRTAPRHRYIRPFSSTGRVFSGLLTTSCSSDSGNGDIDLKLAMKNARANLAAGVW